MSDYDLNAIWSVLSESPVPAGRSLVVAPAAALQDGREVLVGVDPVGDRHVLVPLLAAEQFSDAGRGMTLQLRLVILPEGRYASAVSTDRRLDDVFAQFSRELIATVISSGKPGRDMRVAFGRWQALFAQGPGTRLSKAEEIGLLGELLTLSKVLSLGGSVSSWDGPDRALHDFRYMDQHIEVKSTLAREGLRVSIHGLGQLDVESGESLHLLVYRFEESLTGISLVDVIREIESIVDDLVTFEKQLRRSGFDWQHAATYTTSYASETTSFDVQQDGFPRIVGESFVGRAMPAGTTQITYVIDLSGPTPLSDSAEVADEVLKLIAGQE